MEIKVNQLTPDQQEVEVTLSYEEIQPEIQKAYKQESQKIQIDGFRKGKAPISMIKKLYGESIEFKASEDIANKKFWDVVDTEKLNPISTPQMVDLNFTQGSNLFFKIKYEVKPKLELKDYKDLEVEKPIFTFNELDIQREIDYMLKPHMKFETSDTVEDVNHRITVNLQRLDEQGMPMIGSRSDNILIDLTDEKVNPQIKESAIGKKVNDTFEFIFTDEHYHGEELHKEEFRYTADVVKAEKIVPPEITEELVKKLSRNKATSLEELRTFVSKNFEDYNKKQSEEMVTNNLLDKVVKNNDFTPPAGYVKQLHQRMIDAERENSKRYKMKNFDEEAVSNYYKPRAEWNAKWQIILENLAEKENIKVEDAELEEAAKKESEQTGISVAKLMNYYKDTNRSAMLLEEKVINFLKENSKITEVDAQEKLKGQKEKKHEH